MGVAPRSGFVQPFVPHRRATAGCASLRTRVNSNVRHQMSLTAWVEDLIPGKWPQRLAIATLPACAGAAGLPSVVPQSLLALNDAQSFFVRLLFALFAFAIFEVAIISSVANHAQSKKQLPWVSPVAVGFPVLAALVALSPFVFPATFFPALPERELVFFVASLAVASVLLFGILVVLVAHARKVEALSDRSFWES